MSSFGALSRFMNIHNAAQLGSRRQLRTCLLQPIVPLLLMPHRTGLHSRQQRNGCSRSLLPNELENFFVNALVQAGSCKRRQNKAALSRSTAKYGTALYSRSGRPGVKCLSGRSLHSTSTDNPCSAQVPRPMNRDDYRDLVDYYRGSFHSSESILECEDDGGLARRDRSDGDLVPEEVVVSEEVVTHDKDNLAIRRLIGVIETDGITPEELFQAYQEVHFGDLKNISHAHWRMLLRGLAVVEKKTERVALRYLKVLDDLKAAGIKINRAEWNSAVHLAGLAFGNVTDERVEKALGIWKEMEQGASVQSNSVTFNILFDIATKAGHFQLAEMILEEMETRRLPIRRFGRIGLIYYYGMKEDGNGVRTAYRDLVDSGEIVDTTVLNCVIASLLRAGEQNAAEQVLLRMKRKESERIGIQSPHVAWEKQRAIGRLLDKALQLYKDAPRQLEMLRDEQSLAPDIRTYIIFFTHHVSVTGELHSIGALLTQMQDLNAPPHGRVFKELFRGFALHGGVRYTSWTLARLEELWRAYKNALDEYADGGIYVGKLLVVWALRAFAKCSGEARTLEIWEELKTRWKHDQSDENWAGAIMHEALRARTSR